MRDRKDLEGAMRPSDEPGAGAQPAPAARAPGVGDSGTEGKAGPAEGGTEAQLPDIPDLPAERYRDVATQIRRAPPRWTRIRQIRRKALNHR